MEDMDPVNDLVNLFLREDMQEGAGILKTMTLRVHLVQLANLDAMASYANLSRQAMARKLISAGMAEVMSHLPPEVRADVEDDASTRYEQLGGGD